MSPLEGFHGFGVAIGLGHFPHFDFFQVRTMQLSQHGCRTRIRSQCGSGIEKAQAGAARLPAGWRGSP